MLHPSHGMGGLGGAGGGRSHRPLSLCRPQERALHHPADGRQVSARCSQPCHRHGPPRHPRWAKGGTHSCDHRWSITWSVCVWVCVWGGVCVCLCRGGHAHGLMSSFILFFPPLLPPERRVRPKCMAQRYCPLGAHTGAPPVPPGWALGAQHSPLGGSWEGWGGWGGSRSPHATPTPWTPPRAWQSPRAWGTQGTSGEPFGRGGTGITPTLCPPHLMHPTAWTCPSWPRRPRRSCKR